MGPRGQRCHTLSQGLAIVAELRLGGVNLQVQVPGQMHAQAAARAAGHHVPEGQVQARSCAMDEP